MRSDIFYDVLPAIVATAGALVVIVGIALGGGLISENVSAPLLLTGVSLAGAGALLGLSRQTG